jgi:hypothetical protein
MAGDNTQSETQGTEPFVPQWIKVQKPKLEAAIIAHALEQSQTEKEEVKVALPVSVQAVSKEKGKILATPESDKKAWKTRHG